MRVNKRKLKNMIREEILREQLEPMVIPLHSGPMAGRQGKEGRIIVHPAGEYDVFITVQVTEAPDHNEVSFSIEKDVIENIISALNVARQQIDDNEAFDLAGDEDFEPSSRKDQISQMKRGLDRGTYPKKGV
jgi:hypothetical protein